MRDLFDELYRGTDDPWGFRSRWYERRKRALLAAMLPEERYGSGWEMAGANGELAAEFAGRCGRLLVSDGHEVAVAAARERLAGFPHVRVEQRWMPEDWPEESFDLLIFGEVGYYLGRAGLEEVCGRLESTLNPGGTFVACHWRHPIEGCELTGDEVHQILADRLPWLLVAVHREEDFLVEVWTEDGASVARKEGLR